ncbi:MAG TPA: chromate efflux transporter [Vicinamibacteria bacterium]
MPSPLGDLALLFLRLGATGFGGPAAHVALMETEVVRRRGWLSHQEFLDLLGAANLVPGPNSTELAIHIGHRRAGWRGLLVAGACFILPAALVTLALAAAYVQFRTLPELGAVLRGVKPVVIAVVLLAIVALGRTAIKGPSLAVLCVLCAVLNGLGVNELALLLSAGGASAALEAGRRFPTTSGPALFVPHALLVPGPPVIAASFSLGALFLASLKIGAVLYGSGYVLLAFLRADFVERLGWLTEAQLLDAVAVGQVTPGPVLTTATFVGYLLAGPAGAAVATVAIFLPAFLFVALSGPLVPRLRRSPIAGAFLDGVNVASLALMAVVTWHLGRAALVDLPTVLLAATSVLALVRFRVNTAWLVLAGGLAGLASG